MNPKLPVLIAAVLLSGCRTVQYAASPELSGPTVQVAQDGCGYGGWSRKCALWIVGTGSQSRISFAVRGPSDATYDVTCIRAPKVEGRCVFTSDRLAFQTQCTVRDGGAEVGTVRMTWADRNTHEVDADVLGTQVAMRSSRRLEYADDRTPVGFDVVGAVYGYDVTRGDEQLAAIKYIGTPGLELAPSTSDAVRSTLELSATVILAAHRLENEPDRWLDLVAASF